MRMVARNNSGNHFFVKKSIQNLCISIHKIMTREKLKIMTVRIPTDLYRQIQADAENEGLCVSTHMRAIVYRYLRDKETGENELHTNAPRNE